MSSKRSFALAAALVLSACRSPATLVEVIVDSDAPRDRVFTLRTVVFRGAVAGPTATPWTLRSGTNTGEIAFPSSFSVVPGATSARDERVSMQIEATLEAGGPSEPELRFRRTARWAFVPNSHGQIRVFLPVRCGSLTAGCATVSSAACTVSTLCEERGQTCGDDGTCVTPDVVVTSADAGIDAAVSRTDGATDSASDARMDATSEPVGDAAIDATTIDALRDSAGDAAGDSATDSASDATGGLGFGRDCVRNAQCSSGSCVVDLNGRGACSRACAGSNPCPAPWVCNASMVCAPPTTCTNGFAWTDGNGDGSLLLTDAQRLGVSAMGPSFSFACTAPSSLLTMCEPRFDLTLTGMAPSVLLGRITPTATTGTRVALNIRAAAGPVFIVLDNTRNPFDINVDAASALVAIRAGGASNVAIVGNSRAMKIVLTAPTARVTLAGVIAAPVQVVSSGSLELTGTLMGGLMSGGSPPAEPACP